MKKRVLTVAMVLVTGLIFGGVLTSANNVKVLNETSVAAIETEDFELIVNYHDNAFDNGFLRYLGMEKEELLSGFKSYDNFGMVEGSEYYMVDDDAFGFEDNICLNVYCDFEDAFPEICDAKKDFYTVKDVMEYIGCSAEYNDDNADMEGIHIVGAYENYVFLIDCDDEGNIMENDMCKVVMKN